VIPWRRNLVVGLWCLCLATLAALLGLTVFLRGGAPLSAIVVLSLVFWLSLLVGAFALTSLVYTTSVDHRGLTLQFAFGDRDLRWDEVVWYRPLAQWWRLTRVRSYVWVILAYTRDRDRPRVRKALVILPEVLWTALTPSNVLVTELDRYIPDRRRP
jgi:hypothetical protein